MAQSGAIYKAVDNLNEQAKAVFADLESNDDLTQLASALQVLGDRAFEIRSVVVDVDAAVDKL